MKILLATLHSKYSHSSLALPYLAACCSGIHGIETTIREWTVNETREHILKLAMAEQANIVGLSCYIWNIEKTLKIASDIKKISPQTYIVLGGPEVSFRIFELMHDNPFVDFVIKGEGEPIFRNLIEIINYGNISESSLASVGNLFFRDGDDIVSGRISADYFHPDNIPSPFDAGLVDLERGLVYCETSRGCPFSCAFCLSSVEGGVRTYKMERIKSDLLYLINHRVPRIKLVDRTFNYDASRASQIWEFILRHNRGSHFHFEISADLLTEENFQILTTVPENTFRFEIGIQSASETSLQRVNRKSDLSRIAAAVRRIRADTNIELHLDLVAGLPGEDYAGFLKSLQFLASLAPHEIQIEPLKVLKGTAMREIASREHYHFSDSPPYTILRNPWLSFEDICRIENIGRLLDLLQKHGGFSAAMNILLKKLPFAAIFDKMAGVVGNETLTGLSRRRVYELFARLARTLVDRESCVYLYDALFFDYCRSEMPLMGKLPSFALEHLDYCSWPGLHELPAELNLPNECRVKLFRYRFICDYREEPHLDVPADITFIYASAAGRGLEIITV